MKSVPSWDGEMSTDSEEGGGGVMLRDEGESILQKDRANSTYELLLRKAVEEGRIGGAARCRVCGMRYNRREDASACCEKVLQHNRL
jgi:hypothetical protein